MPLDRPNAGDDANRDILDLAPGQESFRDAALRGLAAEHKAISPKFLYDARGAELFERICEQPEYYPTRTEMGLLRAQDRSGAEVFVHRRKELHARLGHAVLDAPVFQIEPAQRRATVA